MYEKLTKPYDPKETEERIYKLWEESGFFNPETCIEKGVTKPNAEPFTIVFPPPNVTGVAHLGHAARTTTEDIMIRYHRMKGDRTLWIPGTDHAAIATQSKVEKIIQKEEGKSRYDLGREELLRRVNEFAQNSHDTIVKQVKKLGGSFDWSREAFTLDHKRNLAVRTAFKTMYDAGLIYRGHRIVNWDPKGQTTISDDEIVYQETKAKMYTFRYAKDFPISISTTRPETKVGDTAVAVHPDDERYKSYIGKEYNLDFAGTKIQVKIVADTAVDPAFGTGALGVTPAHSMIDWEMAQRHGLPYVQVIDEKARMTDTAGSLVAGKKVKEARELIVAWLKENSLLEKEEEITQNLSTAERTGGIIEPLPKLQWFVAVDKEFTLPHSEIVGIASGARTTLKQIMQTVVYNSQIKFVPARFEHNYFHWIDNLRDWCISRQIWYGHRIPVWYRESETYVGIEGPNGENWAQDEDTLDTWFSSALWTFSTLGWPERTEDLKIYHPTSVLETAYEIIFFWVARMILMSGFHLGQIPFHTVYLGGLIRDEKGQKFSKSLGNTLDPLDVIAQFGTDALRMALVVSAPPGADAKVGNEKFKAYKHFANKLWNVARFVVASTETISTDTPYTEVDQKIILELDTLTKEITNDIERYNFHLASEKLYHYIWHTFADIIIEEAKIRLQSDDAKEKASAGRMLREVLRTSLKLLHPFMPFVTEEIWQILHNGKSLLIVEPWPQSQL